MNVQIVNHPAAAPENAIAENRVVLRDIKWQTFKALLADAGDNRAWRIAYDQGVLEIRMPYQQHEVPKRLLEDFVTAIADELEIETMELGALLLEREELRRAIEPDSCFYIQNESLVRSKIIDLQTDPPPDLAIESAFFGRSPPRSVLTRRINSPRNSNPPSTKAEKTNCDKKALLAIKT